MNKEFLKMQKLAGLITESQMRDKLKENLSNKYSQYFQAIKDVITNNQHPITDFDSLMNEIEFTDLIDAVVDATGGNPNDIRKALFFYGANSFSPTSIDQEAWMEILSDFIGKSAYDTSTFDAMEEKLSQELYNALENAGFEIE
jgi:hypothetical protein